MTQKTIRLWQFRDPQGINNLNIEADKLKKMVEKVKDGGDLVWGGDRISVQTVIWDDEEDVKDNVVGFGSERKPPTCSPEEIAELEAEERRDDE